MSCCGVRVFGPSCKSIVDATTFVFQNVDTESIESRITEDGYLVIKGNVKNAENAEEVDINITREDPEAGKPKDK